MCPSVNFMKPMSRTFLFCLLLFLLLFAPFGSLAQQRGKVSLSGYISDAQTGETLIGATIFHQASATGTVSNNAGFYSLGLTPGEVRISFSYVGYAPVDTTISLNANLQLDIRLFPGKELQEVVVTGDKRTEFAGLETGRTRLSMEDLSRTPSFVGETDLIKYAQLLPGIARGYEGFSGLVVRGGNEDENLYLIDGNPLYSVNHLGGLFSTFNPDAVKTASIYKGSFPARFGGRLSSVLDVHTKDGHMKEYHGLMSIGLISSRANFEGPIIRNRTSFSVAVRRTYADLIQRLFPLERKQETGKSGDLLVTNTEVSNLYYFYDFNVKINHKINNSHRLFLTIYRGDDVFTTEDINSESYHKPNGNKAQSAYTREERFSSLFKWGNQLAALGWNWVLSPDLFAHTTASYSHYRSDLSMNMKTKSKDGDNQTSSSLDYSLDSGIKDLRLTSDFEFRRWSRQYIRFGGGISQHFFYPNVEKIQTLGFQDMENAPLLGLKRGERIDAREYSFYAEDEIILTHSLSANIGGRLSLLSVKDKLYFSPEPRLSLRQQMSDNWSIKASYAEMSQYARLLQGGFLSMPTDLWVPSTDRIPPMRSYQGSLGLYWQKNSYEASLEGYYKYMSNFLAYRDGDGVFLGQGDWRDRVALGNGRAYGAELLLRKNTGRLSGWLSYTLSWADRIFPGKEVNLGNRYFDKFDNRHRFNACLIYKLSPKVDLSAVWVFSSGNRVTIPVQEYIDINGNVQQYIRERNNFKMPDYHRLDLGLNIYRPKASGRMGIWNISVYNAYQHHNSFLILKVKKGDDGKVKAVSISPFIFNLSVSYTFKF
ncbi:tonB-dependent receptor [Porphyromonas crevioricanis JCM 15906]|uniref:TonB-dependent receptor n=2 Tax=Porphyromonas crevioricanis TaxID=393921 RepID=S4N6I9_9PORP|nr:tonB-dependent receptor [Porphyromonas crevioricanis JCM 15906]SJZ87774.1 Outer membrane receptor for ferrienterochelin and colicins [Porphyromonas crevioricanis]